MSARRGLPVFVALALGGCGSAAPSELSSSAADAAASRVRTPPEFRRSTCDFLNGIPYARCYRRNTFAPLSVPRFAAWVTAAGLAPENATTECSPGVLHHPVRWERCQSRARIGSVAYTVFAHSIVVLQPNRVKRSDRALLAKLRGTGLEVDAVTNLHP